MTTIILSIGIIAFLFGLVFNLPAILKAIGSVKGNLLLISCGWIAVFIGQGQMFAQEETTTGISSVGAGALYQLGWMVVGFAIIISVLLKTNIRLGKSTVVVVALLVYGLFGIAGSVFSPAPLLSIYKSGQIIMDAILLAVVVTVLYRDQRPQIFLEITYFLVTLVLLSAALGGVFWPEIAFHTIEDAYTGVLKSYYPQVHSNELGLLSAIILIASLRRYFEPDIGKFRYYWAGCAILAAVVLYQAQARTSLASCIIAVIILAFFIPRMRLMTISGTMAVVVLLVLQWVSGGININIEGSELDTYLRRGASDEQISSLSGRIGLWAAGAVMISDAPILGHGMDAGVRYGAHAYGIPDGTNMHSAHMQILVNSGVVGYIVWLVFILASVRAMWRAYKQSEGGVKRKEGRLRLEILLVAFVILFRSFLGHVLVTHQFNFMVFFSLFICSIFAFSNKKRESADAVANVTDTGSNKRILVYKQRK